MLVSVGLYKIVVWNKPNGTYYHKVIKSYFRGNYHVGYKNRYGHVVVDVIDIEFYIKSPRKLVRKKLLRRVRSFIDKLEKNI